MGLHFPAFWPCGPSLPFILAFSGSASGALPTSCQKWPVCPPSLQWIYQRRERLHFAVFSLLAFHFLAFWPYGPSFPCILALWAFISLHFGLVGLHFLAFWPCGPSFPFILAFSGSASGAPPTCCQESSVCPTSLQWIYQRRDRLHFAVFSLLGPHFLAFWPCGPSFPCTLALWAFISLHFGLVGLHFLAFWPCGPSFPCILALWAFISLHFDFPCFWPFGPSFPYFGPFWAFLSFRFGVLGAKTRFLTVSFMVPKEIATAHAVPMALQLHTLKTKAPKETEPARESRT